MKSTLVIKEELLIIGTLMLLGVSNAITYHLTKQHTVDKVVDNITYFCYNNRNGAVLEGSDGVYILCQGVRM